MVVEGAALAAWVLTVEVVVEEVDESLDELVGDVKEDVAAFLAFEGVVVVERENEAVFVLVGVSGCV